MVKATGCGNGDVGSLWASMGCLGSGAGINTIGGLMSGTSEVKEVHLIWG